MYIQEIIQTNYYHEVKLKAIKLPRVKREKLKHLSTFSLLHKQRCIEYCRFVSNVQWHYKGWNEMFILAGLQQVF